MADASSAPATALTRPGIVPRLSIMMFLQFFVWRAWYVAMNGFLTEAKMEGYIAAAYTVAPIAAIIAPLTLGLIAAWKSRTAIDYSALVGSLMAWAAPTFWFGIIVLFWGSSRFGLPIGGKTTPGAAFDTPIEQWQDIARHLIYPRLPTPLSLPENTRSLCAAPCWKFFPKITSSLPKPKG